MDDPNNKNFVLYLPPAPGSQSRAHMCTCARGREGCRGVSVNKVRFRGRTEEQPRILQGCHYIKGLRLVTVKYAKFNDLGSTALPNMLRSGLSYRCFSIQYI